jgi:hypothetical protein
VFTPAGLDRLAGTLPELRDAELTLRAQAAELGIVYEIPAFGGLRTAAEQAQLVKWRDEAVARGEPSYPVAPAGASKHGAGGAFDLRILRVGARDTSRTSPDKDAALDAAYRQLADRADRAGLRAGYFFSRSDPFHFELPGTLAELARRWGVFAQGAGGTVVALALLGVLGALVFREVIA